MSEFVILTDSSADLSAQLAEGKKIQVLPLCFLLEGEAYHNYPDNREMDPKVFYDRLRGGEMATTSAVNVEEYVHVMEPLLQEGKDVLVLAFSSALSATYNSACVAAEEMEEKYPERKVLVVDTLCASLGQGMLVWLAAQQKEQGRTIEQVRDWVEENKQRVCHQFTVDDLNFLKRGGRISATTAVLGSMLQIKPVLQVNSEGRLVNVGKVRGRHAALKELVDKMEKTAVDPGEQTVFISHGDCLEDAQLVADMIRERMGVKEFCINYVGPVIGAHAGPGVVALFYLGSER